MSLSVFDLFAEPFRVGDVIDDRYEVRERLGAGGHGAVYRVHDRVFRNDVALKVLQGSQPRETLRARFRREAEIAHRLGHPNLLRVFELVADGPAAYFTMELIEGESLAQRLRRGALETGEALAVAEQLFSALAHLHTAGLLHRDVKPSNLLLQREGGVKLADLGLALPLDQEATRLTGSEALLGTLAYLSPEQALGKEPTPASDLYAAGLVLYEMLAGEPPYRADSSLGALLQRLSKPPATLRTRRPDLPLWLHRVVERLLEPQTELRYESAAAVVEDLRARRAALSPRRRKLRRRTAAGVSLALTCLAALGYVVSIRAESAAAGLRIVDLPNGGVRAIDESGRERWRAADLARVRTAPLRTSPGGALEMIALRVPREPGPNRLDVLDPLTGSVRSSIALRSPAEYFPDYSDYYKGFLQTLDLDGDGAHEVLLERLHILYFPTSIALYEPRLGRYRDLFVSSGHHRYLGSADLDGDGDREILVAGINNALGWHIGIAALEILPRIDEPSDGVSAMGQSPDRQPYTRDGALLWYALAPPGGCVAPQDCLRVDREHRLLHFSFATPWTLDFEGFAPSARSDLSPGDRNARRSGAYAALREATRMLAADDPDGAAAALAPSVAALEDAGLPVLERWVALQHAIALLRAGEVARGTRLVEAQLTTPAEEVRVAFEVAQAFHLAGDLEGAIAWYRRGLGQGFGDKIGRGHYEYLRGISFALAELERWDEAIDILERYGEPGQEGALATGPYIALLKWRRNGTITEDLREGDGLGVDEARHLWLELRHEAGEDPETLLKDVQADLRIASYTRPALESLRAVLLAEVGDYDAARAAIATAYTEAGQRRRKHVVSRLLFPLVEKRWRALLDELPTSPRNKSGG